MPKNYALLVTVGGPVQEISYETNNHLMVLLFTHVTHGFLITAPYVCTETRPDGAITDTARCTKWMAQTPDPSQNNYILTGLISPGNVPSISEKHRSLLIAHLLGTNTRTSVWTARK